MVHFVPIGLTTLTLDRLVDTKLAKRVPPAIGYVLNFSCQSVLAIYTPKVHTYRLN